MNIFKAYWSQNQKIMIDKDFGESIRNTRKESQDSVCQEMIDLVDNLIDASPKSMVKDKTLEIKQRIPSKKLDSSVNNSQVSKQSDTNDLKVSTKMISSYGILKYDSGNVYEGQFLNGKRSGNGQMTFANGDEYVGMWKNDQMCDHEGVYTFKNGDEYRGSFKTSARAGSNEFGVFHGQATLRLHNLGDFTGTFEEDKIQGPGKFKFCGKDSSFESRWQQLTIGELRLQMSQLYRGN